MLTPPGLAGWGTDVATRTITVRWKGPVPDALRTIATDAAGSGMSLVIEPANYSQEEVLAAGRLLRAQFKGQEWRPALVYATPERDALIVGVTEAAAKEKGIAALAAMFESLTGMPVQVRVTGEIVGATRQNDATPWSGGALIVNSQNGGSCSTGFAVLDGAYGRLLSAAHCDLSGNASWYDGTESDIFTYGSTYVDVRQHDWESLLIDPVGGTQGKVYGGPWNAGTSDPHYKQGVAGASATGYGDSVCTSGANSGEHCGIFIVDQAVIYGCPVTDYDCYGSIGEKPNNAISIAQGDSGGPVYAYNADGRVRAKGIISGFYPGTEVTCPSMATGPGPLCSYQVIYVGINPLLTFWGVTLETSP